MVIRMNATRVRMLTRRKCQALRYVWLVLLILPWRQTRRPAAAMRSGDSPSTARFADPTRRLRFVGAARVASWSDAPRIRAMAKVMRAIQLALLPRR